MPVPPNPTITIYFYGLAVMCFDKDRLCQVGIQSYCNDHELKISVIKKGPNPVPASAFSFKLDHKCIRQSSGLWLDVETPNPSKNVAERYENENQPFDRATDKGDPQDFRWVIDFESDVHDHQLEIVDGRLKPSFFLTRGLFYTAVRTDGYFKLKPLNGTSKPLGRVARYVAANLYLEGKEQVVLKLGAGGPELLRIPFEKDTSYEVVIDNSESESYAEQVRAEVKPWEHDNHFDYYYDAFKLDNKDEQYQIVADKNMKVKLGDIFPPCNVVWLSQTTKLP